MIYGIGTDIVDIRRIESLLNNKFIARCFTDAEQIRASDIKDARKRIAYYAKRYAAKEACAKALGCGIGSGAGLKDIECLNNENGAPVLMLYGAALKTCQTLAPDTKPLISLSDERDYAIAYVVISD